MATIPRPYLPASDRPKSTARLVLDSIAEVIALAIIAFCAFVALGGMD